MSKYVVLIGKYKSFAEGFVALCNFGSVVDSIDSGLNRANLSNIYYAMDVKEEWVAILALTQNVLSDRCSSDGRFNIEHHGFKPVEIEINKNRVSYETRKERRFGWEFIPDGGLWKFFFSTDSCGGSSIKTAKDLSWEVIECPEDD